MMYPDTINVSIENVKGSMLSLLIPSERRQADLFELVSEMNPKEPGCDLKKENSLVYYWNRNQVSVRIKISP